MRDHNGQQLAYVYFEDEPGGDWRLKCSHHCQPHERVVRESELSDVP
jgi:hypothetical protein